ncbi:cysteine-rich receptor-like protein kinase 44 [Phragmites australis]|uniref:cysteine-rich receptor-like protein kinase 44 n=1 Tax=Phragmites australis TaxID=29695 RepID=UPI002D799E96|nr:cysteine-rich receptor-like protein kinase 44 [Phragmites australis]XP_062182482.1 cysteine-rich receptor-like protein kinase 44 [Phragmites australis]XP_062182483.1 cysteine-rich receptor-like protein kinase 44 [Phragmites australis]
MEPTRIEYQELEKITDGFAEERKLGEGGYGKVYWGLRENGDEIAVKMLRDDLGLDDNLFQNEFGNLMKLKHDNIVRLVGFCYESKGNVNEHNGRIVVAEKLYRALCFEYMHNGSLQKHLSDESYRLNWHASYKIIKEICEGLQYLHCGSDKPVYHLDLKPDNILLDKNMVAKLADFGLSKIFDDKKTKIAQSAMGTRGYMPPEFIERNIVSNKNDIFSLGVVILEIVTGPTGYSKSNEMSSEEFIDLAQEKWRNKLQATWSGSLLEEYCRQVKICTEIALECVHNDRKERPSIVAIIERLNEAEPAIDKENKIIVGTYGLTTHRTLDIVSPLVVKLGMWGGNDGSFHDLSVMPRRLVSVTIRCGEAIDSIMFSYIGADLNEHMAGPWGGPYGEQPRKIILGPNEIVKEISGTYAHYKIATDVIRSLSIVTNVKRYSFGELKGNTFRIPVENNGHVVGFYARSEGWFLNAIGVYIHP